MLARGDFGLKSAVPERLRAAPLPAAALEARGALDARRHPGRPGDGPLRAGRASPLSSSHRRR
ncbi:MAG: hypothetical protein M0C28_42680 [Candidatus Moduliflexus flocculans]|nr:hypothetical protein [Candidatus Moduliflexus flocculans]